jgi:hypothetical protein
MARNLSRRNRLEAIAFRFEPREESFGFETIKSIENRRNTTKRDIFTRRLFAGVFP